MSDHRVKGSVWIWYFGLILNIIVSCVSVFISDSCVCIKKETLLELLENEAVWIRWTLYVCLFCISLRKSKFLYDEFLFWGLRWVAWFDCKQGTCLQMMWLVPWRNTDGTWWIQWWPEPKLFTKTSAPLWASLLLFPMLLYSSKNGLILLGLLQMSVEKKVGTGDAKDVICGAVEKLGADILVMGSHDYGFFKRYTQPTTHFSLSTVMMKSLTWKKWVWFSHFAELCWEAWVTTVPSMWSALWWW